jgi:Tol biopolymer transport system component
MRTASTLCAAAIATLGVVADKPAGAQDSSMRLVGPGSLSRLPLATTRRIRFTTSEGTWMSLDVSPDGRWIVFDMLGDLYRLPITGGRAHRITSGPAFDRQPRFSPDGRHIVFVSDRDGANNIWVCDVHGRELQRVSDERLMDVGSPAWAPDGKHIVARRIGIYSVERWHGAALWLYAVNRSIPPVELTQEGGDNSGPTVTRAGIVYFADVKPVGPATLWRLDLLQRRLDSIPDLQHSAIRPTVSHDGALLAYPVRGGDQTAIRLLDLNQHTDRLLVHNSTRPEFVQNSPNDDVPGYAFTPDDRSLVYTANGHIQRVDVRSGHVTEIPFSAFVDQQLPPLLHSTHRLPDSELVIKQTFGHRFFLDRVTGDSSDVFAAAGGLFERRARNRRPRQLVAPGTMAFDPDISPDGRSVVYATYPDTGDGHIEVLTLHNEGASGRIDRPTTHPGRVMYSSPMWATDTRSVLVVRRLFNFTFLGPGVDDASICRVYVDGRPEICVGRWSRQQQLQVLQVDSVDRVLYAVSQIDAPPGGDGQGQNVAIRELDLRSGIDRAIVKINHISNDFEPPSRQVALSPNRHYVAFQFKYDAFVQPIHGDTMAALDPSRPAQELHRASVAGARDLQWTDNGTTLAWSYANVTYRASLHDILSDGHRRSVATATPVDLHITRPTSSQSFVLRGATVVTMGPAGVIASADVVVRHNRIAALGRTGQLAIPKRTPVLDVRGMTVIPGLIDTHFHTTTAGPYTYDSPQLLYWLAAGITTARDPNSAPGMFAEIEQLEVSDQPVPRLVGTGFGMIPANVSIGTLADAMRAVRRYQSDGAVGLKQYQQPDRVQRQWLNIAARAYKLNMTNEGGQDFLQSMTTVLDGFTGIEHQFEPGHLYRDVIELVARSKTAYTPTMLSEELSLLGVHSDPEALAIHGIRSDSVLRIMELPPLPAIAKVNADTNPLVSFAIGRFGESAAGMAQIAHHGGRVTLGTHDAGTSWDPRVGIWIMVFGGMTPLEALRCATQYGADAIGYGDELGSIQPGKLADLVILGANPLDDIRNLMDVRYVMVDGRLRSVQRSPDGTLATTAVDRNNGSVR